MQRAWVATVIDLPDRTERLRVFTQVLPGQCGGVPWFAFDAPDDRGLEVAVPSAHADRLGSLAPDGGAVTPSPLSPERFPGGEVPEQFPELLVAATVAAVRLHSARSSLAPFDLADRAVGDAVRELVVAASGAARARLVVAEAAAWLERVIQRRSGHAVSPPSVDAETVMGARLAHIHVVQLCLPPASDAHLGAEARMLAALAQTL